MFPMFNFQYLLDKLLTLFDRSGHGGADRQP